MFSYFGSKSKTAQYYPRPRYDTIIEPFAGSAQYAMRYWQRNVLLSDLNEKVVEVWRYLIGATKADILAMPILESGQSLNDFEWTCQAQKWLMGFVVKAGNASPALVAGPWRWRSKTSRIVKRMAEDVGKVKHWQVRHCDYRELPNVEATWFVDSPYSKQGTNYPYGSKDLDFGKLAEWCRTRRGQVIVCEALGADWLDFNPLGIQHGSRRSTVEVVWLNEPMPQMQLL